jgi:hypothetical protein
MSDALKVTSIHMMIVGQIVRIFLCTFEEVRICSVCRSDKWFIAMCYIGLSHIQVKFYLNFRLFVLSYKVAQ